jgi:Type IV secretion-system coupling protein DNA-binding domain
MFTKTISVYLVPASLVITMRLVTSMAFGWDFLPSAALSLTFGAVFYMTGGNCYEMSFRFEEFGWQFSPDTRFRFTGRYLLFAGVLLLALTLATFAALTVSRRMFGEGPLPLVLALLAAPLVAWPLTAIAPRWFLAYTVRRGTKLLTQAEAEVASRVRLADDPHPVRFGPVFLRQGDLGKHTLALGKTGSFKSKFLRLMMQSTLPLVERGQGYRGLVYDAKQDICSYLVGMGISPERLLIVNPFDERGLEWAYGVDCCDGGVKTCQQLGYILLPEDNGHNRYFTDAARELIISSLLGLVECCPDGDFTFRHHICIAGDKEDLLAFLKAHRGTLEVERAITFLEDPKTTPAILSTVLSRISRFAPIAAAWSVAQKRFSLKTWIEEANSVLVLPRDYSCKDPLDAMNRVLFTRATQLLLSQPDVPDDQVRTFKFVDEARNLGPLDLTPILTEGRSRGVAAVLAFVDMDGFRDAQGSENKGNEIAAMCSNVAVFKLKSPTTARYAADLFGKQEVEDHRGMVKEGYAVTPDQFQSLPEPSRQTGSYGYYSTMFASYPGFIPGYVAERDLLPPCSDFPNFVARDPKHQYLKPLTSEERTRFGLPARKGEQPTDSAQKPTGGGPRFRYQTKGGTTLQAVSDPEPIPEPPSEQE